MSPPLESRALCRKCIVGPSGTMSPMHQSQMLQKYPLCGLSVPPCCGWAMIAAGMLVGRAGPQTSCLWGPAATAMDALVRKTDPRPIHLRGLVATAVGVLVDKAGPQSDCLWGLVETAASVLRDGADPQPAWLRGLALTAGGLLTCRAVLQCSWPWSPATTLVGTLVVTWGRSYEGVLGLARVVHWLGWGGSRFGGVMVLGWALCQVGRDMNCFWRVPRLSRTAHQGGQCRSCFWSLGWQVGGGGSSGQHQS